MWTKKNSEMKTREQFCQIVAVEFIECVCRFHLRLLKLQCERRELLPVLRFTLPTVHTGLFPAHPFSSSSLSILVLNLRFHLRVRVPFTPFFLSFFIPARLSRRPRPPQALLPPALCSLYFQSSSGALILPPCVVSTFNVLVPP